jgi:hypothetical protein
MTAVPESSSRIRKEAVLAEFPGESMLLEIETKRYHRLNDTAAMIWKGLENEQTDDAIVSSLVSAFEVSREQAEKSVRRFLDDLRRHGLID